jgi:DNA polymerase-3 subunit gamma/tau
MTEYQVIARKFRPQRFSDVVGQAPLVTTLTNAIKFNRLAHAYLFCGTRGTGKTSIARIFAKALNCQNIGSDFEPCNQCSSCKEITNGNSLDVLEIDGASHRGIDDIRQINETVGFTPASGRFKIYLIDEVHMLTKEAFNALLKTLEEPPPNVKFFFATTEAHKVPATILSRCQRFQLRRISIEEISNKLRFIAQKLNRDVEEEAIYLVAKLAEGSLRDAESLFDQILSYHEGLITSEMTANMLGFASSKILFNLDKAVQNSELAHAFELTHQLFIEGKDLYHFVDTLTEHYRNILTTKLDPKGISQPYFDRALYAESSKIYTQEESLNLLEYLIEARQEMKNSINPQITLEAILLHILQCKKRLCIETIVDKLVALEKSIGSLDTKEVEPKNLEKKNEAPLKSFSENIELSKDSTNLIEKTALPSIEEKKPAYELSIKQEINIDQKQVLLKEEPKANKDQKTVLEHPKKDEPSKPLQKTVPLKEEIKPKQEIQKPQENEVSSKPQAIEKKDETLMRFAAVELEGTLKINTIR